MKKLRKHMFHFGIVLLFSVFFIMSKNKTIAFTISIVSLIIIMHIKVRELNKIIKLNNELLKNSLRVNDAMLDINEVAITTENGTEMLDYILEKAIEVVGKTNKGSIIKVNDDESLEFIAAKGFDIRDFKGLNIRLRDSFLWVLSDGKIKDAVIVDINEFYKDLNNDELNELLKAAQIENVKCTLSAPIIVNNKLYGMLNLDSEIKDAYNLNDVKNIKKFTDMVGVILKQHEKMRNTIYRSKYDKLTNTYNRHHFEEIIKDTIAKANKFNLNFSIVVMDLNKLKYVNDLYGHLAGDELLKLFSNIIRENIRFSDIFARYGGDEFILVIFKSKEEDIINKLYKIQNYLEKNPLIINEKKIICSFSYGISNYPKDSKDYQELINIADKRMYENKLYQKSRVK